MSSTLISMKEARRQYFLSNDDLNRLPYEKQKGKYFNSTKKSYRRAHLHEAALRKYGPDGFADRQKRSQEHNLYMLKPSNQTGGKKQQKQQLKHMLFGEGAESIQTTAITDDSIILQDGDDAVIPSLLDEDDDDDENEDPNHSDHHQAPAGCKNNLPVNTIKIQTSSSTLKTLPEEFTRQRQSQQLRQLKSVRTLRSDIQKQFKHVLTWAYLNNKSAPMGTLGTARLMRVEWYEFAALLGQHVALDDVKSVLQRYLQRNLAYSIDVPYVHVMGETHGLTGGDSSFQSTAKKDDDQELGLDPTATLKLKYNPAGKMLSVTGFVCPVAMHRRSFAGQRYSKYYHDDDTISSNDEEDDEED